MRNLVFRLPWLLFGVLMVAPLLFVLQGQWTWPADLDAGLAQEAAFNSGLFVLGVTSLTVFFGVFSSLSLQSGAVMGQRWARKLIYSPLIFPTYVMAYIYLGSLEPTALSPQGQLWGLVLFVSLTLFPYVTIFANLGLRTVGRQHWEAHLALGCRPHSFFRKVVFPKVRPFVVSGTLLVVFETMAEFGAASVLNVPVVPTLIYKVWFGYFSFAGAMAIAAHYLVVVVIVLGIERFFAKPGQSPVCTVPWAMGAPRWAKGLTTVGVWGLICIGFVFPVGQLAVWAARGLTAWSGPSPFLSAGRSLGLATACGVSVLVFALSMGVLIRWWGQGAYGRWMSVASLGYSLPGVILSVGLIGLVQWLAPQLAASWALGVLLVALTYKFLPVGLRPVAEALRGLSSSLDEYHGLSGQKTSVLCRKGYWPVLRPAAGGAFLLIVIEVLKEMPLTLMMAPSSYETLSVQIFNFTSEGEWEKAAVSAVFLVLSGVVSTFLLYSQTSQKEHHEFS